jgi:hypothetical protein
MSPVVIGGFAAIDAALLAQLGFALRDYQRRREHQQTRRAGDTRQPSEGAAMTADRDAGRIATPPRRRAVPDAGADSPESAAVRPPRTPSGGRDGAKGTKRAAQRVPYVVVVALIMLAFLAWLLLQWVSYLHGGDSLASIFGVVAAGALAAIASYARH